MKDQKKGRGEEEKDSQFEENGSVLDELTTKEDHPSLDVFRHRIKPCGRSLQLLCPQYPSRMKFLRHPDPFLSSPLSPSRLALCLRLDVRSESKQNKKKQKREEAEEEERRRREGEDEQEIGADRRTEKRCKW